MDLTAQRGNLVLVGVDIESEEGDVTARAGQSLVMGPQQRREGFSVGDGERSDVRAARGTDPDPLSGRG